MFMDRFLSINELIFLGYSEAEVIFLGCLKISWTDPPVSVCAECPPGCKCKGFSKISKRKKHSNRRRSEVDIPQPLSF